MEVLATHPVLKHLLWISESMGKCLQSQGSSFECCWAIAASTKQRCRNPVGDKKRVAAEGFIAEVRLMEVWPNTDGFVTRIEEFINNAQCPSHSGRAINIYFEFWRVNTLPIIAMQANESVASSGRASIDIQDRMNDLTTETDRSPENDAQSLDRVPSIEPVTATLSVLALHGSSQDATAIDPAVPTNEPVISGVGSFFQKNRGSRRDFTGVEKEMFQHLLPSEQTVGRLYVLKDTNSTDLFKIGYTQYTAKERLEHPGNCLKTNPDVRIVYESPRPFFAARKAEKLVQVNLKHQRLQVESCLACEGGHREWFQADEDTVLTAVESMERFIRWPAYEKAADGEWKLTQRVYEGVECIAHLRMTRLFEVLTEAPMISEPTPGEAVSQPEMRGDTIKLEEPAGDDTFVRADFRNGGAIDSISQDGKSGAPDVPPQQELKDGRMVGIGARAGRGASNALKSFRRRSEEWKRLLRSKSSDVDDLRNGTTPGDDLGGSRPPNAFYDLLADVYISMQPKDVRDKHEAIRTPMLQRGISWVTKTKESIRTEIDDFQKALNREDDRKIDAAPSFELPLR